MKFFNLTLIVIAMTVLASCATAPNFIPLYGAQPDHRQDNAAIAGGYTIKERGYLFSFLQLIAINGEKIDYSLEYIVPPGKYKISTRLITPGDDTGLFHQTALTWNFEEEIEVQAGHTYIPRRVREGNDANVFFEDAGLNFRHECLPLLVRSREINGDNSVQC